MAIDQIETFMAAIRRLESGSFEGDYNARGTMIGNRNSPYYGEQAYGAYQIMPGNWQWWAAEAGLPRAPITDRAAQDYVARFKFEQYYNRWGDWGLVAIAWFAGGSRADRAAREGVGAVGGIKDANGYRVSQYYTDIAKYMEEAMGLGYGPNLARIDEVAEFLDAEAQAALAGERGGVHTYGVTTPGLVANQTDRTHLEALYATNLTDPNLEMQKFLSQSPPARPEITSASGMRANLVNLLDQLSLIVAGGARSPVGRPTMGEGAAQTAVAAPPFEARLDDEEVTA